MSNSGFTFTDKVNRHRDNRDHSIIKRQTMGGPADTVAVENAMDGKWVVKEITLGGTEVRFRHELGANTFNTGNRKVNVTWLPIFRHDGQGTSVAMSLEYDTGDFISADEIGLRLRSVGRTVSDDHPVTAAVFFQKAEEPW